MFKGLRELQTLPVPIEEIKEVYGHDPMWPKAEADDEWLEFLGLCILDKRNGTKHAASYRGKNNA